MEPFNINELQQEAHDVPDNGGRKSAEPQLFDFEAGNGFASPQSFPKEFRKRYIQAMDWRFLAILILSIIFHGVLIYYLFLHKPAELDDEYIIRIQNHYASRFLSSEYRAMAGEAPGAYESELIASASKWAKTLAEETFDPTKIVESFPEASKIARPQPPVRSFEERSRVRASAADYRRGSITSLRDEVGRLGLLGVITSGSGLVDREEIQDILVHADTSSLDLQHKFQEVRELLVPRPGIDYFGPSLAKNNEINLLERQNRARRVLTGGEHSEEIVEGLAATKETAVKKNESFESITDVGESTFGLQRHSRDRLQRRSVAKIREVVLSHNPAIQDCYTRELKLNPGLKGKVSIRFTIDVDGRVSDAEIVRSSMANAAMEACILSKIRNWRDFGPVAAEQGDLTIRHTYVFGF